MIKLQNGDCLDLMPEIESQSIDMILCDLPYGVTQNQSDTIIPFEPLWEQYKRIIKPNGVIALFAQGRFYVDLVNSNPKWFKYDLVWDKQLVSGFLNAKKMPLRRHEQIAIFYKQQPTYNPQFSVGQPLHSKGQAYKTKDVVNQNYGKYHSSDNERAGSCEKYPTSILPFQKPHPNKALHRTEKPIALLEYLIKTYTSSGETVLDNCMGSGSTGVACVNTQRSFIGIEIDENYFNIAKSRINTLNQGEKNDNT